jgi:uncharacterized protein with FMN-binding domain
MRRTAIVLVATCVGLALVLGYHAHPQSQVASTNTSTATVPRRTKRTKGTKTAPQAKRSRTRTAVGTDQPLAGGLGDIQVRVTAQGDRITSVGLARLNLNGPESQQISSSVIPQLEQQTLVAQSANINGVSGATYTSQAYEASLQAALDNMGLRS